MTRPADVFEDLAFLRKNDGFNAARLWRTSLIAELLQESSDDQYSRLESRFISAIHSLDASDQLLLLDVFGLTEETTRLASLAERRKHHAVRIERSVETVASREAPALDRLALKLIDGSYTQSPLLIRVPEMHGGIIYQTTATHLVVRDRLWVRTDERYRFVATFDEVDFVGVVRSYPAIADTRPGGEFRVVTETASAGFEDQFHHLDQGRADDQPMVRGGLYDLDFTLRADPAESPRPITNAYRAFHERSLFALIEVEFIGEVPPVIWSYERMSHFAQPGEPNESNAVEVNEAGVAQLLLRDVHGGLVSGVAWRW